MTDSKQPELILFNEVEQQAKNIALNAATRPFSWHADIEGLLSQSAINKETADLKGMSVDEYITHVLDPAESTARPSAKTILRKFRGKIHNEVDFGSLYAIEITLEGAGDNKRRVGIIAQNRAAKNGVWSPEHHIEACELVADFSARNIPIITFMDTPGADAGSEANNNNQAHSISRLIAYMANVRVPSIGIIYGLGYSGGAIPLATTNLVLSVRKGVFNTIQPKGLANIARQYNLSWQESARYVGISPFELYQRGVIDGVIDWDPEIKESQTLTLVTAILSGIEKIEAAAIDSAANDQKVMADYQNQVQKIAKPDEHLEKLQKMADFDIYGHLNNYPSVFSHALCYLRSLSMRTRIRSTSVNVYGRLAEEEIPSGDLNNRQREIREKSFERWHADPEKLVYNDQLFKAWRTYKQKYHDLSSDRGRLTSMLLGDPKKNFDDAQHSLCFILCLYLYNRWKSDSEFNFIKLGSLIEENTEGDSAQVYAKSDTDITLLDLIYSPDLKQALQVEFKNLLTFDALYNNIVNSFGDIAEETRAFHSLSQESLQKLLDSSVEKAVNNVTDDQAVSTTTVTNNFADWMQYFVKFRKRGEFLNDVEEWKRVIFPRMSDSLLVLITFFFENLVPEFMNSQLKGKKYEGRINPAKIGKRKDFWNQLNIAYRDLLIQRTLDSYKRQKMCKVDAFTNKFFSEFDEIGADMMTANPVAFPGFRLSIEKALNNKVTPCGVVTGIGKLAENNDMQVGVVISNVAFQAGAFDMAGAEKLCQLMQICADKNLPLICFVSSGGMQTKEGANALFSMAIVNDRLTHFIKETSLPVVIFGFGDCTGGSQASFVTHPLVHTYYFSGTDLPFAGRVVVQSFLPSMSTCSNYLARTPGAMQGLVKHPFHEGIDEKLKSIDPDLSIPTQTVTEVIEKIVESRAIESSKIIEEVPVKAIDKMGEIKQILIHARGCTAVKLIRIAQQLEKRVLLVQSDPDMGSVATDMLGPNDEVVCLGGQTPDESYLNAQSVITIANSYGADSLHPGIGFLSENAGFARLCRKYNLNFIGPRAQSMDTMGNKSNAIHTAMSNNVPVVPGSHGILTSAEATAKVAEEIGYPVLLKAVHGGGGKGIKIVRHAGEVRDAFNSVFAEARSAFGNGDLYLEKFVESMRHIEVQILRDSHGNTKILGLRDCTVQRNNQKVLEESASTMLPKNLENDVYACAESLANAVEYYGAGTVEFIYDLKSNAVYFMEMNTRLQVEHPVTEWTSEISIVSEQFRIAEGLSIESLKPKKNGFAIEARITAEKAALNKDGEIDFIPTPGLVTECEFPNRDDMELICSVGEGKTISPFYDSMIAQLILHGKDREDAIEKLITVLEETSIKGVCTNIPLLKRILRDKTFRDGDYDTNYLPTFLNSIDKNELIEEMAYTGVDVAETDLNTLFIEGTNEIKVLAPMTGIFYATPSPTEPDYVTAGSKVNVSSTICQIEAMKLFTQISLTSVKGAGEVFEANKSYEVVRINQANGAQVNAGDLLFVVRPFNS